MKLVSSHQYYFSFFINELDFFLKIEVALIDPLKLTECPGA